MFFMFFNKITNNSSHILQQYIPDRTTVNYNLRSRPHNKTLIPKTSDLNERNPNQKPVQGLLLTFHCWATMLCCVLLWIATCYSISHLLICLYFIMYIVLPSHLFYRILYPPLSTLLPLMFVISCVCQLFNKECMMWWCLCVSHQWRREKHPAKTAPVLQYHLHLSSVSGRGSEQLRHDVIKLKWRGCYTELK